MCILSGEAQIFHLLLNRVHQVSSDDPSVSFHHAAVIISFQKGGDYAIVSVWSICACVCVC